MYLSKTALVAIIASLLLAQVQAQFWRFNALSERDIFALETRAGMASGICYRQEPAQSSDPTLRMQTLSYCCEGYRRTATTAMQCDPICTEDCTNGICTAPDECTCFPGYDRLGGRCEEL